MFHVHYGEENMITQADVGSHVGRKEEWQMVRVLAGAVSISCSSSSDGGLD